MKPTQQEIIDLAHEASGHTYPEWLHGVPIFALERLVHLALDRFGAGGGEPVYAFRRKGQGSFCTCDESRYLELSEKPNLFEVEIFYPSPTDLRAEYLRGLEDAAEWVEKQHTWITSAAASAGIRALKGKQ